MLDCGLEVSKFKLQLCYCIHFQTNTLEKGMNPLSSQQWLKWYHCCSSTRMVSALNNP